jgi:hypothetical protein
MNLSATKVRAAIVWWSGDDQQFLSVMRKIDGHG